MYEYPLMRIVKRRGAWNVTMSRILPRVVVWLYTHKFVLLAAITTDTVSGTKMALMMVGNTRTNAATHTAQNGTSAFFSDKNQLLALRNRNAINIVHPYEVMKKNIGNGRNILQNAPIRGESMNRRAI